MPVRKGSDFKGRYYQWGSQKKYYYHNEKGRKLAKRKAILQGYAIEKSEQRHGKGVLDNIKHFIKGRTLGSPELEKYVRDHGDEVITGINVGRIPLGKNLRRALSILTLGGIDKAPYDTLFHLFANITTNRSGREVEKNEVIRVGPALKTKGGEHMRVNVSHPITIRQLIENGIHAVGKEHFYKYRAFSYNCQDWIANCLLKPSGLLTPELKQWILQDARVIASHLPSYSERAANALTDLGARARTLVGQGTMPGRFRIDLPPIRLS